MANTFSQLYVQVVFAVKGRANLIAPTFKEELYKYIAGIISNKKQKLIIINGMPDHVHLLIGQKPDSNLSELVRDIKANSSRWINEKKFLPQKFEWQSGFGAFSVGHRNVSNVINYILRQEEHHAKKSFLTEFTDFLTEHDVEYNREYLPDDHGPVFPKE